MKPKHPTDRMSLPVMQCDKGCGDCCGPVQCHGWEYQRVMAYADKHGIKPVEQGITCPFFQQGTCAVYEVRPFACRMFGHSNIMGGCSRGYKALIPLGTEKLWLFRYSKDNQGAPRFLHESLGDGWDTLLIDVLEQDAVKMKHLNADLLAVKP